MKLRKNKNILDWIMIFIILSLVTFIILWWVTNSIENYKKSDDPKLYQLREILDPLTSDYPEIKNIKLYKSNKSYTINKEKIYLCLNDENGDYYHDNMLIYVLLHELAHVCCDEIGHTQKFHNIFDKLLKKSHEMGIYNSSIPVIQNYCEHKNHGDEKEE